MLQVTRHLIDAGHVVHIVTAAPANVFVREIPSANLHVRKVGLPFCCSMYTALIAW